MKIILKRLQNEIMSDENKIRIVLFGEGGVGKSALTIRYFQVCFLNEPVLVLTKKFRECLSRDMILLLKIAIQRNGFILGSVDRRIDPVRCSTVLYGESLVRISLKQK